MSADINCSILKSRTFSVIFKSRGGVGLEILKNENARGH